MSLAGIFVLVDPDGLRAEVQRRISTRDYFLIPVYDDDSRELASKIQQVWFDYAPARDEFYGALFPEVIDGRGVTLFMAPKRYMQNPSAERVLDCMRAKDVLLTPDFPGALVHWLNATFTFPAEELVI